MTKWQQTIKNTLANYLSFPKDVMLDLPRITTIGNLHTYIENHHGIVSYDVEQLIVNSQIGQIKITGSAFVIKQMLRKELLLEGKIDQIVFLKKDV